MDQKQAKQGYTAPAETGGSMRATATYEVKSWDEKTWDGTPWAEAPGAKLTHAAVTMAFHGDIEGEGRVHFLMTYPNGEQAHFVGLQQITGQVGGRSGSFVLQVEGDFMDGAASSTLFVVPGSGTGELAGLRGEGFSVARHGDQQVPFTLDYDFEE